MPDHFFDQYWQEQPLLIRSHEAARFSALFDLETIDWLLTSAVLGPPRIRMAKGGSTTLETSLYTRGDGSFDPLRGVQIYREGGTLILNHLHLDEPKLRQFCQEISDELGAELQCNAYVTPPGSQGFPIHYDTHDVFIAQTRGSKCWKIYDSPIILPLAGQPHDKSGTVPGKLSDQFELGEGDVLYLPRGFYHEAATSSEMSVHLTLGLMTKTWSDLLLEAVSCAAVESDQLREAPPPRFGLDSSRHDQDRDEFLKRLDQVRAIVQDRSLSEVLRPEILYPCNRSMAGHFVDIVKIDDLTLDSVVVLRSGRAPALLVGENVVELVADETTISFPLFAHRALQRALDGASFKIGDLSNELDDNANMLVVRKLIEAGLLGLVR